MAIQQVVEWYIWSGWVLWYMKYEIYLHIVVFEVGKYLWSFMPILPKGWFYVLIVKFFIVFPETSEPLEYLSLTLIVKDLGIWKQCERIFLVLPDHPTPHPVPPVPSHLVLHLTTQRSILRPRDLDSGLPWHSLALEFGHLPSPASDYFSLPKRGK